MVLHECWSLKMISQNPWVYKGIIKTLILSLCFIFQNFKLFICFLHNTLCYLWFWEKNKILLEVWQNNLNIVTHNLNKHPSWIHEFILKERLVYIQDLFKPVVFYKFKYKFPVFVQGLFGKPLMLWPFEWKPVLFTKLSHENKYVYKYIIQTSLMFSNSLERTHCFLLSLGKRTLVLMFST